jgi:hypothetical protein
MPGAYAPIAPKTPSADRMGSGGMVDIVHRTLPARYNARVVVDGDLITIEARTPKGLAEISRSDCPYVVPPRQQQEARA